MHEIHKNLFVGPQSDYEQNIAHRPEWRIVHATKEPYHRAALGYVDSDASPKHPEYLYAVRGQSLMLNLIDATVEVDIPKAIFDKALTFIHAALLAGSPVLIHCTQGVSRSASIGMLYLRHHTDRIQTDDYAQAAEIYSHIYPPFSPGIAIRYFLNSHWGAYATARK